MKRVLPTLLLTISAGFLPLVAAAQQSSSTDSMKNDSMSQGMSHDQMSQTMGKPRTIKGWVTDSECAAEGNKKCDNKEHIAKGAKLVIVSDSDKKVWTVSNPATLADHQGHHVQVKATADAAKSTVDVQEVKMLK